MFQNQTISDMCFISKYYLLVCLIDYNVITCLYSITLRYMPD